MTTNRTIVCVLLIGWPWAGLGLAATPPIDIGSRRELFVDRFLIERLDGLTQRLHEPRPAGVALRFDRPHEGVFSGYVTVIKDGDVYRMYYRGLPGAKDGQADHSLSVEVTCYAESPDGINWTRPDLGLFEVQGSRRNNVILARTPACHNFCPFLDARPGVELAQRYKAIGGNSKVGLLPFASADGIHFSPLQDKPIITGGAFDSQNLIFWSPAEDCYVCYFRVGKRVGEQSFRWIARTTSRDFLTWTEPVEMDMGDVPPEHYYTNQTQPYYRAPHLYVSVFARFMPHRRAVTEAQARELGVVGDYAHDCSDACLMTSRGGHRYDRTFPEAFVRPGRGLANWVSRTNYPALGIVPTADANMSLYVQRHYAQPSHHLQRLTLRPDGFASLHAAREPGELLTRLLVFSGRTLALNVATSAGGEARVELLDGDGRPFPGFGLDDCDPIIGDDLDRTVTWQGSADVSGLAGKPLRLRCTLKEADLYALRFSP